MSQRKKRLALFVGLFGIFLCAFTAWRQWSNTLPEIETPTAQIPSPNAYDFYLKAAQAIVPPETGIDPIYDDVSIPRWQWKAHYPITRKESWLRQNASAMQLLREGLKHDCRIPLQEPTNRLAVSKSLRWAMRMLVIESHVHHERGNHAKAAASLLDTLQIGHDILRGGHAIHHLNSATLNSVAYSQMWKIIPDFSAAETHAIRKRLETIYAGRVPFVEFLRTDKYFVQKGFIDQLHREQTGQAPNAPSLPQQLQNFVLDVFMPRRMVFQNYTNYVDAFIVQAQKPYAAASPHLPVPDYALGRIYAPVYLRTRWNYARVETKIAFLITALALHTYRLERNSYPQKLEELIPRYLAEVPADPYGHGELLRYRLSGSNYTLYSISADGIDDGGKATQNEDKPKNTRGRYILNPESKGDFVAGINY